MIETNGERESGKSVLAARPDDDIIHIIHIHMVWISLVLWHINHCRLFNAKSIFIQISK